MIQYSYGSRRQRTFDRVTTLGGSTDGYVRAIGRSYDSLGRVTKITSYENSDTSGAVRNEVILARNGLGQTTASYQEHAR